MTTLSTPKSNQHWTAGLLVVLAAWFTFSLTASLNGFFNSGHKPPIQLGAAVAFPVILYFVLIRAWPAFGEYLLTINPRVLTLVESSRVMGVVFIILYAKNLLPGQFALPAGIGDVAVGITAPFVAAYLARRNVPLWPFVAWTIFGMLDLIVAVSMGVLSSPTPAGILAGPVTTQLLGQFPLSLIPTFFVPLLFIMHLILLRVISRTTSAKAEGA
jgi:hypothetical protein